MGLVQPLRGGRGPRFADSLQVQRGLDRAGKDVAPERHDQPVQRVLARASRLEVATLVLVEDAHDPFRRDVARAANRARGADRKRGDQHRVASGEHTKAGHVTRSDADALEVLEVPARILDAADRAFGGEHGHGDGLDDDFGELRNVVDEDRHRCRFGDPPVEGEDARLVHRVVERWRHQHGVRAQTRSCLDLGPGGLQVRLRHAADHRNASGRRLDHGLQDCAPGGLVQRGTLTGGPEREQAVHPAGDDVLHQPGDRGLVHASVPLQRGSQSDEDTGEAVRSEHGYPAAEMTSTRKVRSRISGRF